MDLLQPFDRNIIPYIEKYQRRVSVAGIRYGSLAYLGFGPGTLERITHKSEVMRYPIAIEIGADEWIMTKDGIEIINSDFESVVWAREIMEKYLIGRIFEAIDISSSRSTIYFDDDLRMTSRVQSGEYCSGFLYCFSTKDGQYWDTNNGIQARGPDGPW